MGWCEGATLDETFNSLFMRGLQVSEVQVKSQAWVQVERTLKQACVVAEALRSEQASQRALEGC